MYLSTNSMDNSKEFITVKGAREHNLRGVDLQIPKGKLVVFSGVSGSGKSSMAMDTLYAEGQRRYVESLSSYARQFLGMMRRPDVDVIEGLSPAISIDQHGLSHNPRSTVGTSTEIYDYLRLLYARIGHPHCPNCGREISKQTGVSITGQIIQITKDKLQTENNARFLMLSPVVRDKRGEFGKLMENLLSKGFTHSRIDGRVISLKEDFLLIKTNRHNIDAVIDRISIAGKKNFSEKILQSRILEAVELALDMSDGLIILAEVLDKGYAIPENPAKMKDYLFSQKFACPLCSISLPEVEPRLFSFNSPQGACPECGGIGAKLKVDRSRISPWRADMLESQYYKTTSDTIREEIEKLMVRETCSSCHGSRLKKEALSVTIDGKSISTVSALSLEHFFAWSKSWQKTLDSSLEKEVSTPIFNEIVSRLNFLNAVGVEYLTLDRTASTLSVGEAQRIRLASQIGAGLSGVLYVLDEPTVGLHQRDTQRLIKTLQDLRDLGNTVIVVEHDTEVLNAADYIIDFGPLAGKKGGQIVAVGTPAEIKANRKSLTGKYLSGKKKVAGTAIHPGGNVARHLGGEDFNTSEVKAENEKDTSGVNAENLNFLTLSGCSSTI